MDKDWLYGCITTIICVIAITTGITIGSISAINTNAINFQVCVTNGGEWIMDNGDRVCERSER